MTLDRVPPCSLDDPTRQTHKEKETETPKEEERIKDGYNLFLLPSEPHRVVIML